MRDIFGSFQVVTERMLTFRKRRKLKKKEKQKRKNPILDWIEVILSAVFIVLLINQYLFQAYQIPSGSMEHTLEINDRIFVNKLIYGPELIPGILKVNGFAAPKRGEVAIFENPRYLSKGPAFDILHRVLYMISFTLIDIDKDEEGNPSVHFLIKRIIGIGGDRIRTDKGEIEFLPAGETEWIDETTVKERFGFTYPQKRIIPIEKYDAFKNYAIGTTQKEDAKIPVTVDMEKARSDLSDVRFSDVLFMNKIRSRTLYGINPNNRRYGDDWRRRELGWSIAEGYIFPLGDNRDNSKDARYFNAVPTDKVLGRASFRFWPPTRLGGIK